ncbi:hypothetical protein FD18_GL001230 [Lactobacillus taiwanensis DSM 21401]|uniref:hypothetical protein n=1 Tax=Lactobacillus TaxID=1578 RepID=UPI0006EFB650|nr:MULTISPECIES: hypothetical protein [Lactobacillus]KRM98266.1 hypothetical protein FD18_GL001230 [Lactobacillus taiwanensis DSM 21401]MDE6546402.1 hypothetical protein [Lactobacillus sp.]
MKLFVFECNNHIDEFIKDINDWVNLHKEITIVDYDFGYDNKGLLKTVVVKWK